MSQGPREYPITFDSEVLRLPALSVRTDRVSTEMVGILYYIIIYVYMYIYIYVYIYIYIYIPAGTRLPK